MYVKSLLVTSWVCIACLALICGCRNKTGDASACGNGVVDPGEACDGTELGGSTCGDLGYDGGRLVCTHQCTLDSGNCCSDMCPNEAGSRCSSDQRGVETCARGTSGCLGWSVTADCFALGMVCDPSGALPQCALTCTDACVSEGDTRCSNDGAAVQTCERPATGCLAWQQTDACDTATEVCVVAGGVAECAVYEGCQADGATRCGLDGVEVCGNIAPGVLAWILLVQCTGGETCIVGASGPGCMLNGQGESCTDVMFVNAPFLLSGVDFTADFVDDLNWSGNQGCLSDGGIDAVFAIYLEAGQALTVKQMGEMEEVIHLFYESCDAFSTCLSLQELSNGSGLSHIAQVAGLYYIVLEEDTSAWPPPTTHGYDLQIRVVPDPELLEGIFEEFDNLNLPDLEGCSLVFSPDGTGYRHDYDCSGLSAYPVAPGSSADSTTLSLGDYGSVEYLLTGGWSFPFYSQSYPSIFVGANGYVSFTSSWSNSAHISTSMFFLAPRVAGFDADLDSESGSAGSITVDELSDRVAVTYDQVPIYFGSSLAGTVSFQIVLHLDGTIAMHYLAFDCTFFMSTHAFVGLSNGALYGPVPPEVDLVPSPPSVWGDVVFTEIMYNPSAVPDSAGEYLELHNPTETPFDLAGCTLADGTGVHTFGKLAIQPGGYAVVVQSGDDSINGGIPSGYPLDNDIQLDDSAGGLTLECAGTAIGQVDFTYGPGWPAGGNGVSMQRMAVFSRAASLSLPSLWCDSIAQFGGGDLGTPGAPNDNCSRSVLLTETFDSVIPATWAVTDLGGDGYQWRCCGPDNATCYWVTNMTGSASGGSFAFMRDEAGVAADGETLDTPPLSGAGLSSIWLVFDHQYVDRGSNPADHAQVQVSTNGVDWTSVASYTANVLSSPEFIDLSAYAANQPAFHVRFHFSDGGGDSYYWMVDDVYVVGW